MTTLRTVGRRACAAMLLLSLAIWSVLPSIGHAPSVFETMQDHAAMAADHGHSHGFAEDLLDALHGHGHDVADHDHSQAVLAPERGLAQGAHAREVAWPDPSRTGPQRAFRIDRPPRA